MASAMTELQMQSECVRWFWNNFQSERRMLHCNMANSFNRITGANAKSMGVVTGISDLEFIAENGVVWFIELKLPKGIQSDDQKEFQSKLEERGHKYIIIYSFEEFKRFIFKQLLHGTLGDNS
jgi:hypothetical protein